MNHETLDEMELNRRWRTARALDTLSRVFQAGGNRHGKRAGTLVRAERGHGSKPSGGRLGIPRPGRVNEV